MRVGPPEPRLLSAAGTAVSTESAEELEMANVSANIDPSAGAQWPGVVAHLRAQPIAWQTVLVSGVLGMAFGAAVLIWPDVSLRIMAALAGVWLFVSGLARIVGAFMPGAGSIARHVLSGIVGIVVLIAGLVCLRNLVTRLAVLALLFATTWILSGITEVVLALQSTGAVRGSLLVVGVLSILAGIVLLVTPSLSLATLVVLTGAGSLLVGLAEVVLAFYLRKAPPADTPAVA
jgi:uncharacterized membrane protein HdeD (DUF308 family)